MTDASPRWTVLVCEDNDEDFDTLADAARRAGVRADLRRATTGGNCLDLLRGHGGGQPVRPELVLMDLNTPGIDGREALAEIKADPALAALPVVVLTTSGAPTDVAFCYRAGANAYHVKPVGYPDYLAVVGDVFNYWLSAVALPTAAGR